MEKQFWKLWNNQYVFLAHLLLNVSLLIFEFTQLFDGSTMLFIKSGIFGAFIILCTLIEIINRIAGSSLLEKNVFGHIYFIVRPVIASLFYFISEDKMESNIYLFVLVLTFAELIFHTALDKMVKRVVMYTFFAVGYGVVSVAMIVSLIQTKDSRVTLFIGIREIATVIVVLLLVLFIGETMALLSSYFEKQIFRQNRALEDLNEVNAAMKRQQEKMNEVNEKLGLQKIELQTANRRINRSHDELSVQNEISPAIAGSMKEKDMISQITHIMQIRLDMDLVAVILEENADLIADGEEENGRYATVSTNLGENFQKNLFASLYGADMNELMSLKQTYIKNAQTDSIQLFKFLFEEQELASIICLPIMRQEERLGTLIAGKDRTNVFMDGRAFYENIANQIGIGISNARLYAKMNDMAIRDGLTRIYNRRYLTYLINEYLSQAMEKKQPLSLALFDIDKFKMINDTYGHQCGDEVIRYVAALLNRGALKHGGIAGRYGGEEFVVAFLGKNLEEAYEIVKQIHEQIRNEDVVYGDNHIQVRASAGVASYPSTCSNPSDLLTRADWAMYHSKRNGRDQITVDSDLIVDKM